ncbi:hypothetical protein, partial [Klebsiella pneumoniae]
RSDPRVIEAYLGAAG